MKVAAKKKAKIQDEKDIPEEEGLEFHRALQASAAQHHAVLSAADLAALQASVSFFSPSGPLAIAAELEIAKKEIASLKEDIEKYCNKSREHKAALSKAQEEVIELKMLLSCARACVDGFNRNLPEGNKVNLQPFQ